MTGLAEWSKLSSKQSAGKMTVTTMKYCRCWGLLENAALQTPINTEIHHSFVFNRSLQITTRAAFSKGTSHISHSAACCSKEVLDLNISPQTQPEPKLFIYPNM